MYTPKLLEFTLAGVQVSPQLSDELPKVTSVQLVDHAALADLFVEPTPPEPSPFNIKI